jgi:hypothetical protein
MPNDTEVDLSDPDTLDAMVLGCLAAGLDVNFAAKQYGLDPDVVAASYARVSESGMLEFSEQFLGSPPSTPNGTKLGRPPNPKRAAMRRKNHYMSDRTFARLWKAFTTLQNILGDEGASSALRFVARPNGTPNVTALERIAKQTVLDWVVAGCPPRKEKSPTS